MLSYEMLISRIVQFGFCLLAAEGGFSEFEQILNKSTESNPFMNFLCQSYSDSEKLL